MHFADLHHTSIARDALKQDAARERLCALVEN
jgi:hypothetical protein